MSAWPGSTSSASSLRAQCENDLDNAAAILQRQLDALAEGLAQEEAGKSRTTIHFKGCCNGSLFIAGVRVVWIRAMCHYGPLLTGR